MITQKKRTSLNLLMPILLGFFVMGFVDVVGISTSYVKEDFGLSDTLANLLPMMVFLWFAIFSLPTSLLMGYIGRKKTVLLSAVITFAAMLLPLAHYSFTTVLITFALLGIGNTILQVSLNPLLMEVVSSKRMTSMLTLGQFIKAISSMLGPVIAGVAAGSFGNWHLIFPTYAVVTFLSWLWLRLTPVNEEGKEETKPASLKELAALIKSPELILAFSVILLIVGFEVGLMTAVPKYLLERCEMPIKEGGLGCSLYFSARTLGTFLGAFLLARFSPGRFLVINLVAAIASFVLFMMSGSSVIIFVALFLVGLFCANVFPIIFSMAIQSKPDKANEISALMIMGVAGGAVLPVIMGVVADASSQWMSLMVLAVSLGYILLASVRLGLKK